MGGGWRFGVTVTSRDDDDFRVCGECTVAAVEPEADALPGPTLSDIRVPLGVVNTVVPLDTAVLLLLAPDSDVTARPLCSSLGFSAGIGFPADWISLDMTSLRTDAPTRARAAAGTCCDVESLFTVLPLLLVFCLSNACVSF